jgi:preprotein translocase subunit SecG
VGLLINILSAMTLLCSIFLVGLVLIQRGKGGGLAGAFGGMGGSSAFGAKAGDVFTKVTIRTAVVWFVLNMSLVYLMNRNVDATGLPDIDSDVLESGPITPGAKDKAGKEKGSKEAAGESSKDLDSKPAPAAGSSTEKPSSSSLSKPSSSTDSNSSSTDKATDKK